MLRFHLIRIIQITVAILLIGRAWQHLFWDAPFEYLFSPQMGFSSWFIDKITSFMGWFYLFGIILCFTLDSRDSKWGYIFVIYSAALLLLAQLYRASNNCELPTLFLYSSQFATPIIYYQLQFTKIPINKIMYLLKLSLTLTLGGYAWYAFGFYYGYKPGWVEGIKAIFGSSPKVIPYILTSLGLTEIVIIMALWLKPIQKFALAGILFWGLLLMLASVTLFFLEHPHWQSGLRSTWELLCLLPNVGLSYAIWKYINEKKKEENF